MPNPNKDRPGYGCFRRYMFYSRDGRCCSRDMAKVTREEGGDIVVNVTCLPTAEYDLGEDNLIPEHFKGVNHCHLDVPGDVHNCFLGTQISPAYAARKKVPGGGCCPDQDEVRDGAGICQKIVTDFDKQEQSDEYWRLRTFDGCRREGFWGGCCQDKNYFREINTRYCDWRLWSPVRKRWRRACRWEIDERRRADGCIEL
ncbi:hypothetical protein CP532_4683 [Ophiocordyceps camponoti-leonardi (nom. inval.)]|nr:hypothetical protein CP532_4683 [Ophiocordyceps camponoti-leonardi (nom. inval.)]